MNCPRCRGALATIAYEGTRIETCKGCGGEWLDAGELGTIVQTWEQQFTDEERRSLPAVDGADFTIDEEPGVLSCPSCPESPLQHFNYAATSGVALSRCPSCHGVWLDRDELEKAQILSEEWNKKLAGDLDTYGPMLEKIQAATGERLDRAGAVSSFGFFNSILRYFQS